MEKDIERLLGSRNILYKLANGLNPADDRSFDKDSVFNDPNIRSGCTSALPYPVLW